MSATRSDRTSASRAGPSTDAAGVAGPRGGSRARPPVQSPDATPTTSPKRLARIAGVFYLAVALFSAPVILYVRPRVTVPGDAVATAEAVAANAGLLRVAFVSDLLHLVSFVLVAMLLFMLFKHVNRYVAGAMVTFVAIAVAIMSVNNINHLAAVLVATDPSYATAMGGERPAALVLMFLELHEIGFAIAEVFFGLWLLPLGYLAYKSGYFPRTLAVLLMTGCFAYLTLALAAPFGGLRPMLDGIVTAPAAVAEIWLLGYLLVRGVRTSRSGEPRSTEPIPAG